MRLERTEQFKRDFASLPEPMQRRAEKKIRLFLENPRHPSLRIKKMQGVEEIWEGRITRNYRFTFQIAGDTWLLRRIGAHEILKTP